MNFDSLADCDILTSQLPGLWFSNATVISAGISLNEFDFPPGNGANVVTDSGGPISIHFDTLVHNFFGRFTYAVPLVLTAMAEDNKSVVSANSAFSSNLALSGEPGSRPNELIAVTHADGISRVLIRGEPLGTSFTLTNVSVDSPAEADPQAGALMTTLACAARIAGRGRRGLAQRTGTNGPPEAPAILVGTISPGVIPVGVPAIVKLAVTIADPSLMPESLNLIRVNRHGRAIARLTRLIEHRGEAVAPSRAFEVRVLLCEPTPGPVGLRISVARGGWLRRLLTPSFAIRAAGT